MVDTIDYTTKKDEWIPAYNIHLEGFSVQHELEDESVEYFKEKVPMYFDNEDFSSLFYLINYNNLQKTSIPSDIKLGYLHIPYSYDDFLKIYQKLNLINIDKKSKGITKKQLSNALETCRKLNVRDNYKQFLLRFRYLTSLIQLIEKLLENSDESSGRAQKIIKEVNKQLYYINHCDEQICFRYYTGSMPYFETKIIRLDDQLVK